jgi:hypothetical protein
LALLTAGEDEAVVFEVGDDGGGAPGFFLWFLDDGDAFGAEDFDGGEDIVAPEGEAAEGAGAVFVAGRCEEDDAGVGAGDGELDPAAGWAEFLVGGDAEAEGFGVEGEGCILVADGDAGEFQATDHLVLPWCFLRVFRIGKCVGWVQSPIRCSIVYW